MKPKVRIRLRDTIFNRTTVYGVIELEDWIRYTNLNPGMRKLIAIGRIRA